MRDQQPVRSVVIIKVKMSFVSSVEDSKRGLSCHHSICHCTVSQKFRFLLVSLLPTNLSSLGVAAFNGHVKDLVWAFGQQNFVYLRWIEIFLRYYFSL